jgi:integrase
MVNGLREYLNDFESVYKGKYPDYSAIYNHFADYLDSKSQYDGDNHDIFFMSKFSANDIVEAGVYYLEYSNADSKTAVTKYINAVTYLYKNKLYSFNNKAIEEVSPFSTLRKKIERKINKELRDARSTPPLLERECQHIKDYFLNHTQKRFSQLQLEIVFRLIMLYGFKFIKIQNMKKTDIDIANSRINVGNISSGDYFLEIPPQLMTQIEKYLENHKHPENPLMFCTSTGNPIKASRLNYSFAKIKEMSTQDSEAYCATGLAKYAIMSFLEDGFSVSFIREVTGVENVIISDCSMRFLEKTNKKTNIKSNRTFQEWDE